MKQEELEELLKEMSPEEKAGQLLQVNAELLSGGGVETGPSAGNFDRKDVWLAGSVLNIVGAKKVRQLQREYMEKHPHHIPLLFMADIINGYRTVFPIPLAQGCSFDRKLVEECAAASAREAAASGVHVNFSPMVDLVRDPRWGRVMEAYGEDSFLTASMGAAAVEGYQGASPETEGSVSSCFKHFAGYGAPVGGRDYNNVELSERTFRDDYLPGYQAAVQAGAHMAMTSFNTIDRVPATAGKKLLRDILRGEMGFDGVVISDWAAVEELVAHGIAEDKREAAKLAMEAGVDIDMMTDVYLRHVPGLIRDGILKEEMLDEAVMRILKLKNRLGLFEHPFRFADEDRERFFAAEKPYSSLAQRAARESFVLLKNNGILPLSETKGKICFMGPYAGQARMAGAWSFLTETDGYQTLEEAVKRIRQDVSFVKGSELLDRGRELRHFANGAAPVRNCSTPEEEEAWYREAEEAAKAADVVVLALGEHSYESGEAASRARIDIHSVQMELFRRVKRVNPNLVAVIFSGRPLELKEISDGASALLMTWMPGEQGAAALADVLFGRQEPGGRLSMSLPYCVGQIPVYYSEFSTGRPCMSQDPLDRSGSRYLDIPNAPLYPFGWGMSYTDFQYSGVTLSRPRMGRKDRLTASVTVTNSGTRRGTEVVQMYIRDIAGSVVRPVRELKGFQRIDLRPGESRRVSFEIREDMLRFHDIHMEYRSEPGSFTVFIGHDSTAENQASFVLKG